MRVEPRWMPLGPPEHELVLSRQETRLLHRASDLLRDVRTRLAEIQADDHPSLDGEPERLDEGGDMADELYAELAAAEAWLGELLERRHGPGDHGKLRFLVPTPR